MKPREFDDLLKRKFDQAEFEYNPRNWERLTDELDGRKKKRGILMWWLMPVAGVAASVALAIGVAPHLQITPAVSPELAKTYHTEHVQPAHVVPVTNEPSRTVDYTKAVKKNHKRANRPQATKEDKFAIDYNNAIRNNTSINKKEIDLLNAPAKNTVVKKEKKKIITEEAVATFKDEVKKPQTLSIILSGGYNQSVQGTGFTAGATIRKVVSDKVFIEGEVAFTNSSLVQTRYHIASSVVTEYGTSSASSSSTGIGSKVTNPDRAGKDDVPVIDKVKYEKPQAENVTFTQSYLQVSPAVNYRIAKRLSIGAGPDFQQALADKRPTNDQTDNSSLKRVPLFDVGLIGKTEFSVTKNLKAGLACRKGINNVVTPMGKFIDRDYLQVQVKCAIFNK